MTGSFSSTGCLRLRVNHFHETSHQGLDTSHNCTKMDSPISDCKLEDDELQSQYDLLMDTIYYGAGEAEGTALNDRIREEVSAKPILVKIVSKNLLNWSLLTAACTKLESEKSHPAIKFLIEANPSALLWPRADAATSKSSSPIYEIANHHSHCVLMPWIAERFPWILDHECCLDSPPVFMLLHQYANNPDRRTRCNAATIRDFFEAYPRGLSQENEMMFGGVALHKIVCGWDEAEPDLFIWMVEQCPESVFKTDRFGHTPFHTACNCMKEGLPQICQFMVDNFPETVSTSGRDGDLPIHWLIDQCHHQPVLEAAMLLLNEYPESFDITADIKGSETAPSSDPFIQHAYLQQTKQAFEEAVVITQDTLIRSTCDTFASWASSCSQVLETEMKQISNERTAHEEEGW